MWPEYPETCESVVLTAQSLCSKWGFSDGDLLIDECGGELGRRGVITERAGCWWHRALRILVRKHLVPLLPAHAVVVDIDSCHNPIRLSEWDGKEWDDHANLVPDEIAYVTVKIPMDEVERVVREVLA